MKKWYAMFSQTGTEIYNLSKTIGRVPDRIITNNNNLEKINSQLLEECYERFWTVGSKPTIEEYRLLLEEGDVITMHGWLRIIPSKICNEFAIINLHPAPLTLYPNLKGKDPQERVFKLNLTHSGNTIHKCTSELDSGDILIESNFALKKNYSLEDVYTYTHKDALKLWTKFLKKTL